MCFLDENEVIEDSSMMSPLFAWNDVVWCDDLRQLLSNWLQGWSSVPNNKSRTSFQELKSMYIRVKVLKEGWRSN